VGNFFFRSQRCDRFGGFMGDQDIIGTYADVLAEKYTEVQDVPASRFELIQLKEKLERKYRTDFDSADFKARVHKMLRKLA